MLSVFKYNKLKRFTYGDQSQVTHDNITPSTPKSKLMAACTFEVQRSTVHA